MAQKGPAPTAPPAQMPAPARWHAVLVAGDASLEVWDRAVEVLAQGLVAGGEAATVRRFSARSERIARGAERADPRAVLGAIAGMRPAPGEGCLVFLTMHGAQGQGLVLPEANAVITPAALDRALSAGCGQAPTLVIASGCYSGSFAAPPTARPNRAVLTAARADRSSFGCGAEFAVTVYDGCLLGAWREASTPAALGAAASACVRREEQRQRMEPPSEPRLFLGAAAPAALPRFAPRKPAS